MNSGQQRQHRFNDGLGPVWSGDPTISMTRRGVVDERACGHAALDLQINSAMSHPRGLPSSMGMKAPSTSFALFSTTCLEYRPPSVDIYDAAYLAGGWQRAVAVALVRTIDAGTVTIRGKGKDRLAVGVADVDAHPLERAVVRVVGQQDWSQLGGLEEIAGIRRSLIDRGLVHDSNGRHWHIVVALVAGITITSVIAVVTIEGSAGFVLPTALVATLFSCGFTRSGVTSDGVKALRAFWPHGAPAGLIVQQGFSAVPENIAEVLIDLGVMPPAAEDNCGC